MVFGVHYEDNTHEGTQRANVMRSLLYIICSAVGQFLSFVVCKHVPNVFWWRQPSAL